MPMFSLNMSVSEAEKENSVKQKQVRSLTSIISTCTKLLHYHQVSNALEELNKRIYEHDKNITLGGVKEEVTLKVICSLNCIYSYSLTHTYSNYRAICC